VAIGGEVSVQNVVLGELIKRRGYGYGYELRDQMREFSDSLGYSDTFVYAALVALEKHGLVAVVERDVAQPGAPHPARPRATSRQSASRVYYRVTDAGRRRYRDWMTGAPRKTPLREELHMQLMAADPEDVPHLIAALNDFEEQCRVQLRRAIDRPLGSRSPRGRTLGATLVHDALVSHLQTSMEWAQRTRAALQSLLAHPNGVPGRRRP
jgi:DNA-binding PadR family transcriptional regulator